MSELPLGCPDCDPEHAPKTEAAKEWLRSEHWRGHGPDSYHGWIEHDYAETAEMLRKVEAEAVATKKTTIEPVTDWGIVKDAEGSFSGVIDKSDPLFAALSSVDSPTEIVLYAPAVLPWWKDWYWRLRGRLFGHPYPEEVVASGMAYVDSTIREDPTGGTTVTGRFRGTGKWEIKP